ncbi:MAG: aspartyl protease family protein [Planctomycetota bacterium]|jgi:predicted aspartyl protease
MKPKKLLALVIILDCLFATTTVKAVEKLENKGVLAEFNISTSSGSILLPVTFEGQEHLFELDTGAAVNFFDLSFADKLGKPKESKKGLTGGGRIDLEFFSPPEAFLGPFNLKDYGDVACLDLSMLNQVTGKKISGIIGTSLLNKYIVQIDSDNGKLLFLKPVTEKNSDWGQAFEIQYHMTGWYISGFVLGGIKMDFVIDTGDNGTGRIFSSTFNRFVLENEMKISQNVYETASGTIRGQYARFDTLSLGPLTYNNLIFSDGNISALGLSFFSRHLTTFDFPNKRLYLKKGEGFEKIDETDMSGLHLLRKIGDTFVYSVDVNSPAQEAGIKADDVIISINNKDAKEYELWEIRCILESGHNKEISMTIKRENDAKEVLFLLKKKI